jgi:hypothetical protein
MSSEDFTGRMAAGQRAHGTLVTICPFWRARPGELVRAERAIEESGP